MATYALGYATKTGMEISDDTSGTQKIPSVKIGNMDWPDPNKMGEFIETLGSQDSLISPSGPNVSYLAGAFRQGADVHWANPARITDFSNGKPLTPKKLHDLWQNQPEIFYEYLAGDYQVAELGVAYTSWLAAEAEKVALSNSMDQTLRREMEWFRFLKPDKDEWVAKRLEYAVLRFRSISRKGGIKLPKELIDQYRATLNSELEKLYTMCMEGDTKSIERVQKRLKEMDMASVEEQLAEHERRVEKLLKPLAHNEFFTGLKGIGPKSRSGVLFYIGNPLQFPSFMHLGSYNGMRIVEGQGIRRSSPENIEDLRYNHKSHGVLCFDFGDKAHYHEGFFQELYQAYKCHQFLVYWPLVVLTKQIFEVWDKDDVAEGMVSDWVRRLKNMGHDLPMIQKSMKIRNWLDRIEREPSWKELKKLFAREKGGGNLQMTLDRMDMQAKRHNGITLLRIAYYRWLNMLGAKLPIEQDYIYARQYKHLRNSSNAPTTYDPQITLEYYQEACAELQEKGREMPNEAWFGADSKGGEKERFPGLRID